MPRGDRTGPNGSGPMTGRAAGRCSGYSMPGFDNMMTGCGGFKKGAGRFGGGCGDRRGRGHRKSNFSGGLKGFGGAYHPGKRYTWPGLTGEQEAEALKNQARLMQDNLTALNERIQELEKVDAEKEKPND